MPEQLAQSRRVIRIWPQCPEGRNYEQQVTINAMAAAIQAICEAYRADRKHLGLTGSAGGGTACWRLALAMPKFFAGVAPVCALEVHDARLRECLRGTRALIYTDIREGFATGRANEMAKLLEGLDPRAEVIYLGEKELGGGSAAAYCYARSGFYEELLGLEPDQADQGGTRGWVVTSLAVAGVAAALLARV